MDTRADSYDFRARQLIDTQLDAMDWAVIRKTHLKFVAGRESRLASKEQHDLAVTVDKEVNKKKRKLKDVIAGQAAAAPAVAPASAPAPAKKKPRQTHSPAPKNTTSVMVNATLLCTLFGHAFMERNGSEQVATIHALMTEKMEGGKYGPAIVKDMVRALQCDDPDQGEQMILAFIACIACPVTDRIKAPATPSMTLVHVPYASKTKRAAESD
jgi:hypothetical protein